jgi:hypothetical protein
VNEPFEAVEEFLSSHGELLHAIQVAAVEMNMTGEGGTFMKYYRIYYHQHCCQSELETVNAYLVDCDKIRAVSNIPRPDDCAAIDVRSSVIQV